MTNPNTAPSTREERMIVIRRDADDRPTVWCDPEIADLVDALNTYTLGTVASCCGHGERPGTIVLRDGRVLMVFENEEHAAAAQAAYPVDINGDTSPTAALQARVEELETAIKRFITDFENDFCIEGAIVDDPDPMLKQHYILLRATLNGEA